MKKITISIFFASFFYCPIATSSSKPSSLNFTSGLGSPITTAVAEKGTKGQLGFSERAEYYYSNGFSDLYLLQNPSAESQNVYFVNYLSTSYAVSDSWTLGASLPYTYSSNFRSADDDTVLKLGNVSGLMDANLFSIYEWMDQETQPISAALLAGVNVPSGKTSSLTRQGALFSAGDQPGSGAWSPSLGLIFSKKYDKFLLSSNFIYSRSTQGSQSFTPSPLYDYNFAAVVELNSKMNLDGILEINGEYTGKSKTNGVKDLYSSSNSIYLVSGFRTDVKALGSVYLGVSIPLVETFNGDTVTTRYGIIGGIDFSS